MHGDDFVPVGRREDLEWLKNKMGRRFARKTKILGKGKEEKAEARELNKIIRRTKEVRGRPKARGDCNTVYGLLEGKCCDYPVVRGRGQRRRQHQGARRRTGWSIQILGSQTELHSTGPARLAVRSQRTLQTGCPAPPRGTGSS